MNPVDVVTALLEMDDLKGFAKGVPPAKPARSFLEVFRIVKEWPEWDQDEQHNRIFFWQNFPMHAGLSLTWSGNLEWDNPYRPPRFFTFYGYEPTNGEGDWQEFHRLKHEQPDVYVQALEHLHSVTDAFKAKLAAANIEFS